MCESSATCDPHAMRHATMHPLQKASDNSQSVRHVVSGVTMPSTQGSLGHRCIPLFLSDDSVQVIASSAGPLSVSGDHWLQRPTPVCAIPLMGVFPNAGSLLG